MDEEHHRGRGGKLALAIVCVVLLALASGTFMAVRSHSHRSDLMSIDGDGTMRMGSVPLRNTNVRDAALTVVSHLNNGTVSFSATGTVTLSNIAGTMQEMRRAGVSNLVIRSGKAAVETNSK